MKFKIYEYEQFTKEVLPTLPNQKHGYGVKVLTVDHNSTINNYGETFYAVPALPSEWGKVMVHPDLAPPDDLDCGAGRIHVMKKYDMQYATQQTSNCFWVVEWWGLTGESDEKRGVYALRLRMITRNNLWRLLRNGWCKNSNLTLANLTLANLTRANLTLANLTWANLTEANLTWANLTEANLREANLREANLTLANLTRANLTWANLREANLTEANLREANLARANLTRANLTLANLTWANLREANLTEANLTEANLARALYNQFTRFPADFDKQNKGMILVD